jgi:hypothetical protein
VSSDQGNYPADIKSNGIKNNDVKWILYTQKLYAYPYGRCTSKAFYPVTEIGFDAAWNVVILFFPAIGICGESLVHC